jgi:site-specific recombinase XerD
MLYEKTYTQHFSGGLMEHEHSPALTAHITPRTTIPPAVNAWKVYLEDQGSSPHTVKAFTADLLLLASYLPPDHSLSSISTSDLNNFLHWMENNRGVPCSPKTMSRRITSIKAFFRWLHKYGVLQIDPAEKVIQRSVISPLPTVLTDDEIQDVLSAAARSRWARKPDARPYTLVSLLLHTGIKKAESLGINLHHIDLEAPSGPLLFIRYANPQHRYKERKLPLTTEWVEAFQEYKQQYSLTERLFPWSPRRLEYLLEDISEEAGLSKHLSFDMCRWTCALSDWKNGEDPNKIRQKLGISKIQWREVSMKLEQLTQGEAEAKAT